MIRSAGFICFYWARTNQNPSPSSASETSGGHKGQLSADVLNEVDLRPNPDADYVRVIDPTPSWTPAVSEAASVMPTLPPPPTWSISQFPPQARQLRYLLLRNSRHGTWGFAKGHLEDSETALDAAWRELQEETGLTRDLVIHHPEFERQLRYVIPRYSNPANRQIKPREKEVSVFLAQLDESNAGLVRVSAEHDKLVWLPLMEVQEYVRQFPDVVALYYDATQWILDRHATGSSKSPGQSDG